MTPTPLSAMEKITALRPHLMNFDAQNQTTNMTQAANHFVQTLNAHETTATQGLREAGDPHDLVMSMAQSRIAVETIVAVRDKLVQSVNDIMRMPV